MSGTKWAVKVQVPFIEYQEHEIEIEAETKEQAALMAQLTQYDESTFVKISKPLEQQIGTYEVGYVRRVLNPWEDGALEEDDDE